MREAHGSVESEYRWMTRARCSSLILSSAARRLAGLNSKLPDVDQLTVIVPCGE